MFYTIQNLKNNLNVFYIEFIYILSVLTLIYLLDINITFFNN